MFMQGAGYTWIMELVNQTDRPITFWSNVDNPKHQNISTINGVKVANWNNQSVVPANATAYFEDAPLGWLSANQYFFIDVPVGIPVEKVIESTISPQFAQFAQLGIPGFTVPQKTTQLVYPEIIHYALTENSGAARPCLPVTFSSSQGIPLPDAYRWVTLIKNGVHQKMHCSETGKEVEWSLDLTFSNITYNKIKVIIKPNYDIVVERLK